MQIAAQSVQVNQTVIVQPSATAEKSCTDCYEEHRQRHEERSGQASASYRLDPPAPEMMRNLVLSQAEGAQADKSASKSMELSKEEQAVLREMQARDAEVRRHEEAHAAVGGQYAGSPSYTYQTGPDNKRYAIGGEVPIDVAPVEGDPEATIEKMDIVKAAALAPAEPSGQDRKVAALADAQRMQAIADLAALRQAVNESPEEGQSASLYL